MVLVGERDVPDELSTLVDRMADAHPDHAVSFGDHRVRYDDLPRRAAATAAWLAELGVRRGDHVALWMANRIEWLDVWFGVSRLGAVIVPLNTRFAPAEAEYVLCQSGAKWLLRAEGLGAFDGHAVRLLVAAGTTALTAGAVIDGDPAYPGERVWPDDGSVAGAPDSVLSDWPASGEDGFAPGMIQYTSGSTAFPKGAMLANSSLVRNAEGLGQAWQVTPDDVVLCSNPLFHCGGSVFAFLAGFSRGASVVLMARWSVDAAVEVMDREGVTVFPGIDAAVRDLVGHARATGRRPRSLRLVSTAADPALFALAAEQLGCEVSNVFGLTESSPNVAVGDLVDPQQLRIERIGRPQPGIEVEIRSVDTGAVLPPGEVGEIHVRGWSLMSEYYDDDDATAATIGADGFLATGDLGELDDRGYLQYRGRHKQMIKSGGENIAIGEVEEALRSHPGVADAVLVPVPHERFVEVGFAFLRPLHGELDLDDVRAHVRGRLAGFKVPKYLETVGDLPRTGSGKVDRRALAERAAASVARQAT